jgi:uncharacterized iron-regulated protein
LVVFDAMRVPASFLAAPLLVACASAAPTTTRSAPPLPDLRDADVVFFGEEHDQRDQHAYERDLLAAIDGRGPTLLGMEMFQRPFQGPLDDYVAGAIDEKEMLRRTEYFDRWRFDFTLYAPLWRYCREHGVRVVALNAEASIVHDVNGKGIAGLSGDQRAQIAADVDLGNAKHRERIVDVFSKVHPMSADAVQKMYEAMTVWDETMAESAARALAAAGPGARMLVVAGRGHIEEFTGIPDRLAKRAPGVKRVVIVGDQTDKADAPPMRVDGGQFVVSFPETDEPPAPKLGVTFDTKPSAAGLLVTSVVSGGAAAKAGVAAGDRIARLADASVTDMTDLRYVLDAGKVGDVVAVEVDRDGARVPLSVTLAPPPAATPAAPESAPKK